MKDFLLIANKNCVTYKEVFPLFKEGILSIGSPVKEYEGTDRKFGNHGWITTFPVPNKKKLVLTAAYDPELYPKYDNYDAIEVSRVKDIPYDYEGTMGVPITIFQYDLDNVEIEQLCASHGKTPRGIENENCYLNGEWKYPRILIKKNFEIDGCLYGDHTIIDGTYIKGHTPEIDGKHKYARVLIRRKQDD